MGGTATPDATRSAATEQGRGIRVGTRVNPCSVRNFTCTTFEGLPPSCAAVPQDLSHAPAGWNLPLRCRVRILPLQALSAYSSWASAPVEFVSKLPASWVQTLSRVLELHPDTT